MEVVFPVCKFAQKIALRLFADWQVIGKENIPPYGPLIIVANHQSNFDPSLVATSVSRRPWFLAKDGIFGNLVASWFLRSYGAFPLNREGADRRALVWALNKLRQDQVLILYPEGTRSPGGMKRALTGVTRLALRSQAPLLPIGITGTEKLSTLFRVFNPTGKLTVNIGTTFTLPIIDGTPNKAVVESLTDMIMGRIAALLPESYRGVYGLAGTEVEEASAEGAQPGEISAR